VQGFPDAKYKSFKTQQEAEQAFQDSYESHYTSKAKDRWKVEDLPYEKNSIAVDAACS
jgi:viroplasmin and RNaseH domain-containing protein